MEALETMGYSIVEIIRLQCASEAERVDSARELARVVNGFRSQLVKDGYSSESADKLTEIVIAAIVNRSE